MEITASHTGTRICYWLRRYSRKVTRRLPRRPSLSHNDFHLSRLLKKYPAGKRFETNADVNQAATFWLHTPDTDICYIRDTTLGATVEKWFHVNGDYVESGVSICYPFAMYTSQAEGSSRHQSVTSLAETPLGK